MKSRKVFWGIFFILAAVWIVLSKLGMIPKLIPGVGAFDLIITIVMIWLIFEGIRHINFYEIFIPLAIIGIVFDEVLGIESLTPWTLLAASVLLSIGCSMLFRGKRKQFGSVEVSIDGPGKGIHGESGDELNGGKVYCENNFGSTIRYINSDNFERAELENNFGSMSVYFDNAIIQNESAKACVENNFGEMNLYIPKEWKVKNNIDRAFGSVNEKGRSEGTSDKILYITGDVSFGSITIIYV